MKVVALVPIKLNSQRVPHKNVLPIAGHPMCWHICNTLSQVRGIDEIVVYCSDPEVKRYMPSKTRYLQRPQWLDGDEVKGFDIYREFIKTVDADVYVLAHTTSPFIRVSSCQKALDSILDGSHDSAFSAERIQTFAWYNGRPLNYELEDVPRTQDIEAVWVETSAFYMFKKEVFCKYNRRIGFKPYIQEVSGIETIDIDEQEDYEFACLLAKVNEGVE